MIDLILFVSPLARIKYIIYWSLTHIFYFTITKWILTSKEWPMELNVISRSIEC